MPQPVAVAIVLLLAGSLAALAVRRRGPGAAGVTRLLALGGAAAGAVLLAAAAVHREPPAPPQPPDAPLQRAADGDVGSGACRACHPDAYTSWHASYHRTMTQRASPETALGDFDDVHVQYDGLRYRLFERDGQLFGSVRSAQPGAGARPVEQPLVQTTGSHHMQIYWVPTGDGRRLESFPLVYLREQRRWVPRLAAFVTPPQPGPGPVSVWNYTCIGCHSTHPRPRLGPDGQGPVATEVTELGIACESCHGPGREHVRRNRSPLRRYRLRSAEGSDETITNPRELDPVRSAQVCGQCHSVHSFHSEEQAAQWMQDGPAFHPGDDLEAQVNVIHRGTLSHPFTQRVMREAPEFIRGSFWEDGIVRVAGREYNALLEAPCFQAGEMSCLSCHALHRTRDDERPLAEWADDQLAPGMRTNQACVQCHEGYADDAALAEHSHHPPASSGSECQNCHMPYTTYGLLKAIRAHDIGDSRIATQGPSAGRPNACNLCHLDRPLGWSAEHLARWYGQPLPALDADDRDVAAGVRWALEGDAGVRALVAWSMGWKPAREAAGDGWVVPYLALLMEDPYDAVRIIAHRSLTTLPTYADARYDPLANPARRALAARAIHERWAGAPAPERERAARTLVDAQGRLDAGEVARLLSQRDDRPLNLAE